MTSLKDALPIVINSRMSNIRQLIALVESKEKKDLVQADLPYKRTDLDPVLSENTLDYHYGKLYKGYVDRFNSGEGDSDFNEAGAYLHNIYFTQLQVPKTSNKPHGASLELINRKFNNYAKFQKAIEKEAMGIQGSGWVYMSRSGEIKTIKNHQIKKDIALLIDWWEHAWVLDYQADKAKYLKNTWRLINWETVNRRIYGGVR
jgi:Fe-Mn family superoxide dismutase